MKTVPNPQALGNIRQGFYVFRSGIRTAEAVFRAHLRWNRGAAAEHHFADGYKKAAQDADMNAAEINEALRLVDPLRFGNNYEANKVTARAVWLKVQEEERP